MTQAVAVDWHREVAKCIDAAQRPIHFVGVGNTLRGDDAVGVKIASQLRRALRGAGALRVKVHPPDASPERLLSYIPATEGLVIFDAIEAGGQPGQVLCASLGSTQFGFFATHNIPLRIVPGVAERKDTAYVIGVEPESLELEEALTPKVRASANEIVAEIVRRVRATHG